MVTCMYGAYTYGKSFRDKDVLYYFDEKGFGQT
jgi:hypothetical protein